MSQATDRKRGKCPNMSEDDKEVLVEIVLKYANIVENKKTDAVFAKAKRNCWKKIANEYNSSGRTRFKRTGEQLLCIFKNMKARLKKNIAIDRAGLLIKTDGEPYIKIVDENNPLLQIVNKEKCPLVNEFDSSVAYWENDELVLDDSVEENPLNIDDHTSDSSCESTSTIEKSIVEEFIIKEVISPTTHSTEKRSTTLIPKKKRRSIEDLRLFVAEYGDLKKRKLESQIAESVSRQRMYNARTELLRLQQLEMKCRIEKEKK